MKIKFEFVKEYDTNDPTLRSAYLEQLADYPDTWESLLWFITDQFISSETVNSLDQWNAQVFRTVKDNDTLIDHTEIEGVR